LFDLSAGGKNKGQSKKIKITLKHSLKIKLFIRAIHINFAECFHKDAEIIGIVYLYSSK
jgi:hypothetical protein